MSSEPIEPAAAAHTSARLGRGVISVMPPTRCSTPEVIAPMLLDLLDPGSATRETQLRHLDRVLERLGEPGASARVAEMAVSIMEGGS